MKTLLTLLTVLCIANTATSQLYISSGATLHLSGSVQITLQNMDFVNDGTLSAPANGRVIFNGSAGNEISGTAQPGFAQLEIAKTGSGLLTLQTDNDVAGKIAFTSNLIALNNHSIDLGGTGMLEGEDEGSHITGTTGGEVMVSATLNAPSAANPGNLGAVITSTQNLGATTIQRGHQSQTTSGGGGASIQRYFDIAPANNTGLNATLRINYLDAEKNTLDENIFEMWRSDDYVSWTDMNFTGRDATANYVELTGIANFSRWTLSPAGALPVTGLILSGIWKNNTAHLNWMTLTEYHNRGFNIERKYRDDPDFLRIGNKPSAHNDGTALYTTKYTWIDHANAHKGLIQYRLQQEDRDGRIGYSNVIVIKPKLSELFIKSMYPNVAVESQLYILTGDKDVRTMRVYIFDMNGRRVFAKELNYQSQWLSLPKLSAGAYKMLILSVGYHWEGSFVKE